ncbi:MAG: hypothetical protein ERJ67_11060 [Aphanocapsa feldmannii 277cV]|uniref:Uncharacterized protein n=1 Tax=Aphanocapsa feldmannii 277cV TaxID=2507553 RepID=A0A524RKQ6_9CHRO|nr:MAG: hypothetical protein ERJ67_11060 [Aphanocapsa feldmannii 277cV]
MDNEGSRFSPLADTLIEVLIYGSECKEREEDCWSNHLKEKFGKAVKELRYRACEDNAVEKGIEQRLLSIADKLDAFIHHSFCINDSSNEIIKGDVAIAVEEAARLKAEHIDVVPLSAEQKQSIHNNIRKYTRLLSQLDGRAEAMANKVRVEKLKGEASFIGYQLLFEYYYRISDHDDAFSRDLHKISRGLHLIETEWTSNSLSIKKVVDRIHDLSSKLKNLLSS